MSQELINIAVSSLITSGIVTALVTAFLQKRLKEKQFKFERLHEERIKIIADIYSQLRQLEDRVDEIADTANPHKDQTKSDLVEAFSTFRVEYKKVRTYFEQRRILLSEGVADLINDLLDDLRQAAGIYRVKVDELPNGAKGIEIWLEFKKNIDEKIKPFRKSLEAKIRHILAE